MWVNDAERTVLCQEEQGGVPSFAIVGPDGSAKGYYVGHYDLPAQGWGEAGAVAEAKARELGYSVVDDAPSLGWVEGWCS